MNDLEISPGELLCRVNELKELGFTVTFEVNEDGLVMKVTKEKPVVEMPKYF